MSLQFELTARTKVLGPRELINAFIEAVSFQRKEPKYQTLRLQVEQVDSETLAQASELSRLSGLEIVILNGSTITESAQPVELAEPEAESLVSEIDLSQASQVKLNGQPLFHSKAWYKFPVLETLQFVGGRCERRTLLEATLYRYHKLLTEADLSFYHADKQLDSDRRCYRILYNCTVDTLKSGELTLQDRPELPQFYQLSETGIQYVDSHRPLWLTALGQVQPIEHQDP